ncbi:MAG: YggS family pyridoxal phosphate-dependent enzyme [Elusimicrobiota bacterium]
MMHWAIENTSYISNKITEILSHLSNKKCEIMAVIKYASRDEIINTINDGRIKILGENKIQDAVFRWEKDEELKKLRNKINLHFIGRLQSNKVKYAVKLFDSIDSVDSADLAKEIDLKTAKINKKMPVCIQVKINDRENQGGVAVKDFDGLFKHISKLKNLSLRGIMAIGPITDNEREISEAFKKAKKLYDDYFKNETNPDGFKNILSMGMSSDWKIAVTEGSNLIRIGSYLFQHQGGKQ